MNTEKTTSKPIHFYCEFCQGEVKAKDLLCPHCGSFFSKVRCQACGYTGESKLFLGGCPQCGYLEDSNDSSEIRLSNSEKFNSIKKLPYSVEELDKNFDSQIVKSKSQVNNQMIWVVLIPLLIGIMLVAWFLVRG